MQDAQLKALNVARTREALTFLERHPKLASVKQEADVRYLHLVLDNGRVSARLAAEKLGVTLADLRAFFEPHGLAAPFEF